MESYSVEAVLSAVDKNFTSTMNKADSSMGGLDKRSQNTNTSILDIAKGVGVFKLVDSAVGLVRNSLDGAINRFDTLNKYPVVMQALGYSASDVDKSMAKLNKGIDGLPTSLDEIVSNTQQLAISTGSLTKGTDTAIALNNAFLASGASTADASRGMQQYVQMLSKGTVDMQSWRSIQETMPVAMDKVAKSFKDQGVNSVSELYDALQSGKITFDDFNNRLIKLNGGVGGFADLAKKNSAGIKTSFSNVKTAVAKGLENVLSAIDNGMKSAGLGSIAENFDKLKIVVNQVFSAITKAIPPVISVIATFIKLIGNIINALKPFLPVLLPIITTWGAFMVQLKGVGAVVKTFNQVKSAITGVMSTIKILFAIMAANPITVIIGLIAALVVGFIYFWNTSEDFRNFWKGLWEGIKKAVDTAVKGIQSAWNATVKWFSDTWNNIKSGAKGLWDGTIQGAKDAVDSVKNAWNGIKEWFSNLWKGTTSGLASAWDSVTTTLAPFVETIKSIFQPILEFFSGLWGQVQTIFASAWEIIKTVVMGPVLLLIDLITGDFNQFKEDFGMLWQTLATAIQTIVQTFVNIVVGFYNSFFQTVVNIWTTIVNTIQSLWGAFTTWVINMAKSIVDGIVNGWNSFKQGTIDLWNATVQWVKDTWSSFKQWVIDSANAIVNGVKQGWENLKQGTIDLWNGMVNGLKGIWDDLKQGVGDLIDNVVSIFNTLKNINLLDIGKAIIDGFVNGLKSAWEAGMKFIGGIGDWIREHKGPIRVDRKLLIPAGNAIMGGLNKGLNNSFKTVQNSVLGMNDFLANAINAGGSVDIGANIRNANNSIGGTIAHEVNLNKGKQPAQINIRLGKQQFKAFVEDISQAQGWETATNNLY
ncbi:tape measure protein [Lactococcus petauri]|uniref:tape measure protein n=1 Tax=Lactococcus petauri TaxID=1940789 RepID=UPI00232F6FFD|nr:tape measure protein [Lactococcus petauri]MDC0814260.1 tape measure protein [Lactococcus petauri]MDC0816303.1 tape measure protein [Lactococcus petauri]MDC0822828.1 tape measure protein [Lactococcus petauri]MDC0829348.1 tape measure protein [Lactococcus petauri]